MPDVSVIIAAWNAQDTIRTAIVSALNQTGLAIEVIVVDDHSSDCTAEIVASMEDPRIKLIRCVVNGGPAVARNLALREAQGDWVAILDADDTMEPERLKRLFIRASAHVLDIVVDNMWVLSSGNPRTLCIDEETDDTIERITLESFCFANRLFAGGRGYGYLKPMLRASFLRSQAIEYNETLRIGEDFEIIAECLVRGARYGRLRSAYYNYHVGAQSLSRRLSLRDASAMLAADQRYIDRFGAILTAGEMSAISCHLRSLQSGIGFLSMIESLQRHDAWSAAAQVIRTPASLRHFRMPIQARMRGIQVLILDIMQNTVDFCVGRVVDQV